MPSWASISSKPRLTSSSVMRWEMNGSTSISPVHPAVDQLRHLVAALDAAERRAGDAAAGDQEARDHVERLALAGDAGDGAQAPAHARRLDGLAHDLDVAGRLERVVGAEAAGLLEDPLDGVRAADHRVGRALAARELEPLLGQVDADDPLGALEPAAGDGAEADHAGAEDDARRARARPWPCSSPRRGRSRGRRRTGTRARAAPPGRPWRARSPASPCTRRTSRCP